MSAEVGGQLLQSQAVKLRVVRSDPSAAPADSANKLAFLSLELPKKQLFVGETLQVEMRLFLRSDVRNFSDPQIPALAGEGFATSKMVEGGRFSRRVNNATFTVIPLVVALTPVKTGALTLGPVNGSVVAHVARSGSRQNDPFENFFGPQTEARQVPLALEQQTIQVLALPSENVPSNFNGAVGNYTMTVSAGPTNVAVGDPITVKVQIAGQGHLEALALPDQSGWVGFKAYPPTTHIELREQLGVQGTKFFEQLVVPQSADIKALPPVSFSFFDPDKKSYRTLTEPELKLVVRPSSSAAAPTISGTRPGQDIPPPAQDIVPNKQRLGAMAQMAPPLVERPWFLALQGVPLLAFVSALVWRKRTESLANNPRRRRRRQVAQTIRDGLVELRQLASEKKSDEFFATLFRLLQEQLGERLALPASAITEAVVEEHLRPRGVSETTLVPLQELFQTCNLARYAPIKTSQELAAIIPRLESVLRELQELKL